MAITVYMLCDCAKQNKKHPFQHIFRPYLTPVRDEEAESQRKARSRQARQTRRSTQGVTLAELKEAQKMFGLCRSERQIEEADGDSLEKEEADTRRDPKASPSQSKEPEEPSWRWTVGPEFGYNRSKLGSQPESPSKPPSTRGCFYFPSSTSPNHISSRGLCRNTEKNGHEWKNEGEREFDTVSDFILSLRDRRQARDHGRGTDTSFWTHEHDRISRLDSSSSGDSATDRLLSRTSSYTRRENRLASLSKSEEDRNTKDYKKMYEDALAENEKLKSKLEDSKKELAKIRTQLDKVTQKQDSMSEKSTVFETEKREKRTLEKKVSEMEEELKSLPQLAQIQTLRWVNERLVAENRAMMRVIAKLSEVTSLPETEDL
nr:PREDICTED: protein phosphatase 1 regulatory subunit 12B-like isoform X1 [Lepisosteus oculatus]